jgi:hypothetical protein
MAMGAYDNDVRLWAAAVAANGGSVSKARASRISKFVAAEKAAGTWALTDDYWLLWAENGVQALTSLKQRRLATAVNSPTFAADRGYTFDGATNYLDTGFIASTHGILLTGTDMRLTVYERTDVSANAYSLGASNSASRNIRMRARVGANMVGDLNSGAASFTMADSRGYTAISRAGGGTTMKAYKNGAELADVTGLTVGTSPATFSILIGANSNSGTPASFRGAAIGLCAVGAPLSAAQELAQYNAIQSFATSVGANV